MNRTVLAALAAFALSAPALLAQETPARMDFDLPFSSRHFEKPKNTNAQSKSSIDIGNICLGPLFTQSGYPYDFNPSKSFEVALLFTKKNRITNGFWFCYGVGLDWRNFAITNGNLLSNNAGDPVIPRLGISSYDSAISKLKVFSVDFPLLFSVNIVNGFGLTFGPVINLNTDSWIKNKTTSNGHTGKEKFNTPQANLLTVDIMAQINIKSISLFAKYSPMSLMDKAYWPEFEHFSIGIAL